MKVGLLSKQLAYGIRDSPRGITSDMDPFAAVLGDAETQLEAARRELGAYIQSPDAGTYAELNNTMQDLTETIHDLSQSIGAVQADPATFGIDDTEIKRRIAQVGHINEQVSDIQEELTMAKKNASSNATALDDIEMGAEESQELGSLLYQQTIEQQDSVLDSVYDTVTRLREQANVMSHELEDQSGMLSEFDGAADRAQDRLKSGLKRVNWVLENNRETFNTCCITLLTVALVVLLVLVIVI